LALVITVATEVSINCSANITNNKGGITFNSKGTFNITGGKILANTGISNGSGGTVSAQADGYAIYIKPNRNKDIATVNTIGAKINGKVGP